MKITLDIPAASIAQLFSSAIEGGDPVTSYSKGGWCDGIEMVSSAGTARTDPHWYASATTFEWGFKIHIREVADEGKFDPELSDRKNIASGALIIHRIGPYNVARGLAAMAEHFPTHFGQILADEIDAPTADSFLQAVIFGEAKYG